MQSERATYSGGRPDGLIPMSSVTAAQSIFVSRMLYIFHSKIAFTTDVPVRASQHSTLARQYRASGSSFGEVGSG
jgi:hypothetical protein